MLISMTDSCPWDRKTPHLELSDVPKRVGTCALSPDGWVQQMSSWPSWLPFSQSWLQPYGRPTTMSCFFKLRRPNLQLGQEWRSKHHYSMPILMLLPLPFWIDWYSLCCEIEQEVSTGKSLCLSTLATSHWTKWQNVRTGNSPGYILVRFPCALLTSFN